MIMQEWLNTMLAVVGPALALFALWQTKHANRQSNEANQISREANIIARQAIKMQDDESKVRLIVKPQMMHLVGDGLDISPRPIVTVINLSAFPVTVERIWWKTTHPSHGGFFWKNPKLSAPFRSFPARLASRQAVTAVGSSSTFANLDDLRSITAAVACTECGEQVEGMTPQWQEYVANLQSI
jgi:hypothetical protein